jgi:rare lipoprotein A
MGISILKVRGPVSVSLRLAVVVLAGAAVASCGTTHSGDKVSSKKRSKEYFAESAYGVKASPRVVNGGPVPKGGGRRLVGNPYVVAGKVYKPRENPNYDATGLASWYGSAFHGRYTANGEVYDQYAISAAHPTMPLPSYARVTNLDTGSSVIVRVNDRGPFHANRLIDLSEKAAQLLDVKGHGTAHVRVKYVGPADMSGHDMPYLMASYVRKGQRGPGIDPMGGGQIASGVMVASNTPRESFSGRFAGPAETPRPIFKTSKPTPAPAAAMAYSKPSTHAEVATASMNENVPMPAQRREASWSAPAPRAHTTAVSVARNEVPSYAPKPARAAPAKPAAPRSNGGLPPGWIVGPSGVGT